LDDVGHKREILFRFHEIGTMDEHIRDIAQWYVIFIHVCETRLN